MENLNRNLIIKLQNKILRELQQKLSTEDLYYLSFHLDDGTRSGYDIKSTSSEYIKILKQK